MWNCAAAGPHSGRGRGAQGLSAGVCRLERGILGLAPVPPVTALSLQLALGLLLACVQTARRQRARVRAERAAWGTLHAAVRLSFFWAQGRLMPQWEATDCALLQEQPVAAAGQYRLARPRLHSARVQHTSSVHSPARAALRVSLASLRQLDK